MTATTDRRTDKSGSKSDAIDEFAAALRDTQGPQDLSHLADIIDALKQEVGSQFKFEEEYLFKIFAEIGRTELIESIKQDHRVIAPLIDRLAELTSAGRDGDLSADQWSELRRTALRVADLLSAHAAKEEHMLIPAIDEAIAATDQKLRDSRTR